MRVSINGFGRIGRCIARAVANDSTIDLVAINTLGPSENLSEYCAYMLQHDSIHGIWDTNVSFNSESINFGRQNPKILSFDSPEKCNWGDLEIDLVLECTGLFTSREKAGLHISAGATAVLVSAPGTELDATIVYGINHKILDGSQKLVSNASCTTNALAPVIKVLDDLAGVQYGLMNTIHAVTGDQALIDTMHKDWRRGRAAMDSMIPTGTGAARAIGLVLPHLHGKLDGFAIRVPTNNVSLIDLTVSLNKDISIEEINQAMGISASKELTGVLSTSDKQLVSIDFLGNKSSSVFDLTQTRKLGNMYKCLIWYDNEIGFANRMIDTAKIMGLAYV